MINNLILVHGSRFKAQSSKVEVRTVRDTVYVERVDTVEVSSSKFQVSSSSLNPHPSALNYLKWIFALICAVVVLVIVIKVCLRRR